MAETEGDELDDDVKATIDEARDVIHAALARRRAVEKKRRAARRRR